MAKIDRIVNVQIDLRTAAITERSFSDMLILGETDVFSSTRTQIITGADQLLDLGMLESDPIYLAAADAFSQIPSVNQVYIGRIDSVAMESVTDALAAASAEQSGWYGLILASRVDADILEAADWVEANEKLFLFSTPDPLALDPGDSTSILSQIKDGNYFRTSGWYHADAATDFLDAAIMSTSFTKTPGSETWANQRLGGVTTDKITPTEALAVLGKNGNTFEAFRNIVITQGGKVGGGEWLDVIRFRDWLAEQIKLNVFGLLVDNRIPFTDEGIGQVKSKLIEALDYGVRVGGIAPEEVDGDGKMIPSYTISMPRSFEIPFNQKANRTLQDIKFTARLAGAIHIVDGIDGVLTYEL